jgi:murein DD-endopeptidase MepM/ murein hydrolase activator NlpD
MRGTCRAAALGLAVLAAPSLAPAGARAAEAEAAPRRFHEVKRGDTLGAVARRYGVTVVALVTANRLAGPGVMLRLGQRLVIPPPGPAKPRDAAPPAPRRAGALALARPASVPAPAAPRAPAGIVLALPDFDDLPVAFQWPAEGTVTSTYGRRRSGWHRGIDIKTELGTPIQAAAAGVVIVSGVEPRYGRVIKIEHEGGFVSIYAHNDENLVEAGDRVAAGETIATVGKTGRATTHHVHFEIRRDGQNYNPLYLLPLPPKIARVEETEENPPDDD